MGESTNFHSQLPNKVVWHFDFNHPVEDVWPLLNDTDRLNQAIGLPPVHYKNVAEPEGGSRRYGTSRINRVSFEWEEKPYEWDLYRMLSVQRSYRRGPMKGMDAVWTYESTGKASCRVTQTVYFEARNFLWAPIVRFQMNVLTQKGFLSAYKQIEKFLNGHAAHPMAPAHENLKNIDRRQRPMVEAKLREAGANPQLVENISKMIFESYSTDLVRIRPFAWARKWKLDRVDVLKIFLRAAEAGIFSLSWDLLCPSCRGAKEKTGRLKDLKGRAHCDSCNIYYDARFDESVELSFKMSPVVRKIEGFEYCVGGPQNTPHYLSQRRLEAFGKIAMTAELSEGKYRLRSLQSKKIIDIEVGGAATDSMKEIRFGGLAEGETWKVRPGAVTIVVTNDSAKEILVLIERSERSDDVCTAAYATSIHEFRKRFSSEVLAPGQEVSMNAVAFLFTDLKGSTAMYETMGDALSFRLVQQHFDILIAAVEKHSGGIVKTIGDAVMASFLKSSDAVAAAIEIHEKIAEHNKSEKVQLRVKAGIHFGPCYVVTMNEHLDYFGGTVNIAARTEGQCLGGDVVVTQTVIKDPSVADLLQKKGLLVQRFEASLKGFRDSTELYRIQCESDQSQTLRSLAAVP